MTNTQHTDIDLAELNHVDGELARGRLADLLMQSPDYSLTPFPFAVWELTGDYHDWRTDCAKPVAIHRANQSTLNGALRYMKDKRVLVHNPDYAETLYEHFVWSQPALVRYGVNS